MRRLVAILLLALFGFTTAAPLLASAQDLDAHLPACCRRNGAHHCAMLLAPGESSPPIATAVCPHLPRPSALAPQLQLAAPTPQQQRIAAPGFLTTAAARAATQRRISRERSRHKRGPPSAILFA